MVVSKGLVGARILKKRHIHPDIDFGAEEMGDDRAVLHLGELHALGCHWPSWTTGQICPALPYGDVQNMVRKLGEAFRNNNFFERTGIPAEVRRVPPVGLRCVNV